MGKILIFHMNVFKAERILREADQLGHQGKIIGPKEEGALLGQLSGQSAPTGRGASFTGRQMIPVREEMLVLCGLAEKELDEFLAVLRVRELTVSLKAVLTPVNACWTPGQLCAELAKERDVVVSPDL